MAFDEKVKQEAIKSIEAGLISKPCGDGCAETCTA